MTEAEYRLVKRHVHDGVALLALIKLPDAIRHVVAYHHERWDGMGYPSQIIGSETPIEGRIAKITDAYSAMTMNRVYKRGISLEEAHDELRRCAGTQVDSALVEVFLKLKSEGAVKNAAAGEDGSS